MEVEVKEEAEEEMRGEEGLIVEKKKSGENQEGVTMLNVCTKENLILHRDVSDYTI